MKKFDIKLTGTFFFSLFFEGIPGDLEGSSKLTGTFEWSGDFCFKGTKFFLMFKTFFS